VPDPYKYEGLLDEALQQADTSSSSGFVSDPHDDEQEAAFINSLEQRESTTFGGKGRWYTEVEGSKGSVASAVLQGATLDDPFMERARLCALSGGRDPERLGTTYNRLSSSTRLSSSSSSSSDPLQGYFLGPVFLRRSEPQLLQLQRGQCPDTGKQMLLGVAVTGNSVCPAGEVVIK
jgi:hypothetical protein